MHSLRVLVPVVGCVYADEERTEGGVVGAPGHDRSGEALLERRNQLSGQQRKRLIGAPNRLEAPAGTRARPSGSPPGRRRTRRGSPRASRRSAARPPRRRRRRFGGGRENRARRRLAAPPRLHRRRDRGAGDENNQGAERQEEARRWPARGRHRIAGRYLMGSRCGMRGRAARRAARRTRRAVARAVWSAERAKRAERPRTDDRVGLQPLHPLEAEDSLLGPRPEEPVDGPR
jgi:hypothetical protein